MWAFFLLIGCGPGSLSLNEEDRVMRSAWALDTESNSQTGLLFSTSRIPCESTPTDDPTQALLNTQDLSHARSREGSLLIWVPLENDRSNGPLDVAITGYEVLESERMWTDGLIANYRPTDTFEFETFGTLTLQDQSESYWKGTLKAEAPALRVDFKAKICSTEEVFQILGLLGLN